MNTEESSSWKGWLKRRGGLHKAAGALLTVIGIFWLAKRAGWIPEDHGHHTVFWPLVAIAIGLFMLSGARRRRNKEEI